MLRISFLFIHTIFLLGCSNGNFLPNNKALEVHSLGPEQLVLHCDFEVVVSMPSSGTEGEIWATDIPIDLLESGEFESGQIIQMQVLWIPTPGKTPLASTSTNITINQIIISGDERGVYVGAGYGWPSGTPEEGISINMEDATIELQSSTANFSDLLTPATMVGYIHAPTNTTIARKLSAIAARYSNK
jgi:hypothetical protein